MKKIVSILGARPQFVKAAVLSRIIAVRREFSEVIIHTGQHFDSNMSEVFFKEMQIPKPKYNFDINGMGHGAMTGRMLEKIEDVLLVEQPALVVVYGDTNSTLAGALAAKKLGMRVVHVEAGLRSFNMAMPEEVNRILTDRISDLLLCPTKTAISNLKAEGFENFNTKIELCGDIMHDAVDFYGKLSETSSTIINKLGLKQKPFVLATIHRQENTDDPDRLKAIIHGLNRISESSLVVMPVHPRTKTLLEKNKLSFTGLLIDPVGYFDMLQLLKNCDLVVTDSGGLQKEAYFNQKSCLIAREETEWIELVEEGYATIVGSDSEKIFAESKRVLDEPIKFKTGLYGNDVGSSIYESIKALM